MAPVQSVDTHEATEAYNVSIEPSHTYFVGGDDWGFTVWAHNTGVNAGKCFETSPIPPKPSALVPSGAKPLGNWGEARLAQDLGNQGVKPTKPFQTSDGPRYVDRLVDGVAHEAKAGVDVGLTSRIRRQVLKDTELKALGEIKDAVWHFYQGAQQELLDFLRQHGITPVVH